MSNGSGLMLYEVGLTDAATTYLPNSECFALFWKSILPTAIHSSVCDIGPPRTSPHGSSVVGRSFDKFNAALLNNAGSIRLLTNGARKVKGVRRHAEELTAVKSPANIAAVGTNERRVAGS